MGKTTLKLTHWVLGAVDLLIGQGSETQTRNNTQVEVPKLNAGVLPLVNDNSSIFADDTTIDEAIKYLSNSLGDTDNTDNTDSRPAIKYFSQDLFNHDIELDLATAKNFISLNPLSDGNIFNPIVKNLTISIHSAELEESIYIRLNGIFYSTSVQGYDTLGDIAQRLADAINADASNNVTASPNGSVYTITSTNDTSMKVAISEHQAHNLQGLSGEITLDWSEAVSFGWGSLWNFGSDGPPTNFTLTTVVSYRIRHLEDDGIYASYKEGY